MSGYREEVIGSCRLILGDCREVLPGLRADILMSDPPYGQKLKTNIIERGLADTYRDTAIGERVGQKGGRRGKFGGPATRWPDQIAGDDEEFDPEPLLSIAPKVLLWGSHKFGHLLPAGRTLGWNKVPTGKVRDQGDGELAWTNVRPLAPLRLYRLLWDGVCVGSAARGEIGNGIRRVHPTQKPVALMHWCLDQIDADSTETVLDPYMGSGSTLVAAVQRGMSCIGFEIEPLYFETACRRVEAAYAQPRLFAEPSPIAVQEAMAL